MCVRSGGTGHGGLFGGVCVLRPEDRVHVARNKRRGNFNGAIEEASGKVQKASTHASSVGVDLAGLEGDNRWCALIACRGVDATSLLPNKARQ